MQWCRRKQSMHGCSLSNKIQSMYLELKLGSAAFSYSIPEQGTRMHCALENQRALGVQDAE
jgi:hypothetical protein